MLKVAAGETTWSALLGKACVKSPRLQKTTHTHSLQSHLETLEALRFGDYLTGAKTNKSPLQPKQLPW